jgi:hypothetical protein|tara:strand:+ start:580 stop:873 length:294 start_codon:yes stop_codon:yes gene_type:complete
MFLRLTICLAYIFSLEIALLNSLSTDYNENICSQNNEKQNKKCSFYCALDFVNETDSYNANYYKIYISSNLSFSQREVLNFYKIKIFPQANSPPFIS